MDITDRAPAIATEAPTLRGLLKARRFSDLLLLGQATLAEQPDHRDALLFVAIAQRFLGRIADALATLETLERHHPRFSRLYEERGRCFVEMKQAPAAIAAFERAVDLNHALPGSWRMLEGLYRMTGQAQRAAQAAERIATMQSLPTDVVTATGLYADGDLEAAETLVRAHLIRHGDHIEAMRLLALIGIARRVFDDAEILLAAVLEREPGYRMARQEYAAVLVELHKYQHARREIEQLLETEPDNPALQALYATCVVGLGEHERAVRLYEVLLRAAPNDCELHLWIAHAQKTLGRREEAIASYRRAAACKPDFGDAYWSLANLKTYRLTDEEVAQVRAALRAPGTSLLDRYHLSFALAKALEDRGEYAESFGYYELGNRLKRSESNYRPEIIENNTRQQIEVCTREFFAARRGVGSPDAAPIFIVGLPRSGSTLLEQILASHSKVEGTQELSTVQQLVAALRGRDATPSESRYPRILAELRPADFLGLAERYLGETKPYRTSGLLGAAGAGPVGEPYGKPHGEPYGKPFFIDKMPNNFRHIGLIHLMLPNARIIDARREPMACCFSNFKQLFASGQEFTYSIEDIARYYRTYLELMRHWDRVLPGRVLRVHHEDVVADLGASVRRMLDFCGLDFEPACIEFYKTERSVRTASSEQVRQPIYREGLDHWKHFEPWLEPLRVALGDALGSYRDE